MHSHFTLARETTKVNSLAPFSLRVNKFMVLSLYTSGNARVASREYIQPFELLLFVGINKKTIHFLLNCRL